MSSARLLLHNEPNNRTPHHSVLRSLMRTSERVQSFATPLAQLTTDVTACETAPVEVNLENIGAELLHNVRINARITEMCQVSERLLTGFRTLSLSPGGV